MCGFAVTSPLTPAFLNDAGGMNAGIAAAAFESQKHVSSDPKCQELGWMCVDLTTMHLKSQEEVGGTHLAKIALRLGWGIVIEV